MSHQTKLTATQSPVCSPPPIRSVLIQLTFSLLLLVLVAQATALTATLFHFFVPQRNKKSGVTAPSVTCNLSARVTLYTTWPLDLAARNLFKQCATPGHLNPSILHLLRPQIYTHITSHHGVQKVDGRLGIPRLLLASSRRCLYRILNRLACSQPAHEYGFQQI